MLMCVAREKSPIGSEAAMASVWYLPYGEKQAGAAPLHLPVPQPGAFLVSPPDGPRAGPDGLPNQRSPS